MQTQEKDNVICPWCKKNFKIKEYGWKIPCPHCRRPLDIFPEPDLFIRTPHGAVFGIAINIPHEKTQVGLIETTALKLLIPLAKRFLE